MRTESIDELPRRSAFLWLAGITVVVCLVPLVAMQFTGEVNWGLADFVVMSLLLFGTGSGFLLLTRGASRRRRAVIAVALAALFLSLWAELAVGVFTGLGS